MNTMTKHYNLVALLAAIISAPTVQACSLKRFKLQLQNQCSLEAIKNAFSAYLAEPENQLLASDCTAADLDALLQQHGQNAELICAMASQPGGEITFNDIVLQEDGEKFVESFYKGGGTYWNEEVQTNYDLDDPNGPTTNVLRDDIAQVKAYYELSESTRIQYPNEYDNFNVDNCAINAVMCCWPLDRQANDNNGNCNTPYDTECIDKDPADNTDVCGVHLDRGNTSNKLNTDGFTIFENGNDDGEGPTHCHGFAFSNDPTDAETRYMGNNLFYVSMYDHLHQRGYARNLPGAPMCGCVEQMPVVTRSDCTQVDVTETFDLEYDSTSGFSVTTSDVELDYNACQGLNNRNNDLSAYVARLETEGKVTLAQKNELKKYLVENGNCPGAIERNLASKGIVRGFAEDAYEQTYSFPYTDTDQFIHGICVLGASSAGAYSDTDYDLEYTVVPDFGDGVELWGDRDYVVSGIEGPEMCEGGLYLKPNRVKSIDRYSDIGFGANPADGDYVTMCVFLMPSSDSRTGKWDEKLPNDRFKVSENYFTFASPGSTSDPLKMYSYCKTLPEPPTAAPSFAPTRTPPDVSYEFPPVGTSQFVHGLCVMGASYAQASSTDPNLSYTLVSDFKNGVKLWDDRNYLAEGVDGASMCEGGLYLKPSRVKTIAQNTEISLEALSVDGGYVSVCAFVFDDWKDGKWDEELPNDRFKVSDVKFQFADPATNAGGSMFSFCKTLPEPPTAAPSFAPTRTAGDVSYDFPPVGTSEFVHGLCVTGASYAEATSTDPNLSYTLVSDFKNGVILWDDRTYVANDVEGASLCEGGLYLKPSRVKTIAQNTEISLEALSVDGGYVSVCAFVFDDWKDGKWDEELPNDRFKVSASYFTFASPGSTSAAGKMYSYCKTLPEPPTAAPSFAPTRTAGDVSYDFPPVGTSQFVHGLCVMGASYAEATSTDPNLSYTLVSDFKNGVKLWDDRTYVAKGVEGTSLCEGGLYLKPSRVKTIAQNTDISLDALSINGGDVVVCAFVFDDWKDGKWDEQLPSEGFALSDTFQFVDPATNAGGNMFSFCKTFT